jgi:S-adenosylmethionine:tRNA ribosyltransferase-isomerase
MEVSLFDYHLPRDLIAQKPPKRRDQSRLLILDRNSSELTHASFREIGRYLRAGDALVVNDTRVFKARLLGRRRTGGAVDILLIRKQSGRKAEIWEAMVKPSRRLKEGEPILFGERQSVRLLEDMGNGRWQVGFESSAARQRIISRYGHVPLPPYINREDRPQDIRRYQTVYADPGRTGAIAAPTAGFHFTGQSLANLAEKRVEILKVTLHVGPGTFKPIQTDAINDHVVDPEQAELSAHVATRCRQGKGAGGVPAGDPSPLPVLQLRRRHACLIEH